MDRDELTKAVEEARALATEAKLEAMVLQTVCAALMAELAVLTEDPRATLDRMVASLHGLAFGVGQSGGQAAPGSHPLSPLLRPRHLAG